MSGRKSNATAVPWLDWEEWQEIYVGLFSTDDPHEQQRALSRVAAWRSRAQLPIAVNATAQLVELQLHEQLAQHHHHGIGVSSRSHMELSLQYASAVVRCVNGLVDGLQKGMYAMAVSGLAQSIGIPLWIVDLRHESTHNQLPSLSVLRFAAQHLLAWLRVNYWCRQDEILRSSVHHTAAVLFAKMPQNLQQNEDVAEADGLDLSPPLSEQLDADKLRHVVVPLLVVGKEYGERVASTGLLFLPSHRETTDLGEYPKEHFMTLLLEMQSVWPCFSAWLLASLCHKLMRDAHSRQADPNINEEAQSIASCEMEIALLWIKLLIGNEWRERLKFVQEPIDHIYHCGAEMLCCAEEQLQRLRQSSSTTRNRLDGVEKLIPVLRSCKGIRNHPILMNAASMKEILKEPLKSWIQLPQSITSAPLGLRHLYEELDKSQMEYAIDNDSLTPESTCFAVVEDENHEEKEIDEDAQIDEMMAELDAAYDAELKHALELKEAIIVKVIHEGQSVHHKVLPQQELERIQDEIEIW